MREDEWNGGEAREPQVPGTAQEELEAGKVWSEYEKARAYNQAIELYETVEQNENFYIGDQ